LTATTFLRTTAFPSVQTHFIPIQNENNNNNMVIYECYIVQKIRLHEELSYIKLPRLVRVTDKINGAFFQLHVT